MHDVVIAGASVAGAATAIHLTRLGRRVLLVDRAPFPRRKACGEGLFPAGVRELERLDVLERLRDSTQPLSAVRFIAGDSEVAASFRSGHGLGLERTVLDAALLSRACDAGVEVTTGVTVTGLVVSGGRVAALSTSAGPMPGRAFVAADGLHSRLRRRAGLDARTRPRRYGVTAHVAAASPADEVRVHVLPGYEVYFTPTGQGHANVAILAGRGVMRSFAGRAGAAFRELLAPIPELGGAVDLLDAPIAAGPFPARCTRAWRANLVLAGDAAGFFDGISGEGMSAALVSARDCAAAISEYLDSGDYSPLRGYDRLRRAVVRNSNLVSRLALVIAARPALARRAVANLALRPATFEKLVAINTGEAPLRALRPSDLSALLLGR